jgi:hypothetical protein
VGDAEPGRNEDAVRVWISPKWQV